MEMRTAWGTLVTLFGEVIILRGSGPLDATELLHVPVSNRNSPPGLLNQAWVESRCDVSQRPI